MLTIREFHGKSEEANNTMDKRRLNEIKRKTAKAHSLNYQVAHYVWNYVIYGAA